MCQSIKDALTYFLLFFAGVLSSLVVDELLLRVPVVITKISKLLID